MGRGGGVLELKSPFRGKRFLTELGLFHIPAGSLWEVWSLSKGDGEFRMRSPGLPSLVLTTRDLRGIFVAATAGTQKNMKQ